MKTLCSLIVCLCVATVPAFAAPPPKIISAADGIFAAFQTHQLVGIGEWHGFCARAGFLFRTGPRSAFCARRRKHRAGNGRCRTTGRGGPLFNGVYLHYSELRKCGPIRWAGFPPSKLLALSISMPHPRHQPDLATRKADQFGWATRQRIITKTKNTAAPGDYRDSYPGALIEREILSKGKKSLCYSAQTFSVCHRRRKPLPRSRPAPHAQPTRPVRHDPSRRPLCRVPLYGLHNIGLR